MIKAIIFDYFGVLCTNTYWKQVKHDETMAEIFPALADRVNSGELSWMEFLHEIVRHTGQTVEELQQLYETELIRPEVLGYATILHGRYKTAILTNAHHDFIDPAIAAARLYEIFDVIVISSLIGILKPDPRSYQHVLKRLKVKPEEAVLIDDNKKHAAAGAKLGIHTIVYEDFGQMKNDLDRLLEADSKHST